MSLLERICHTSFAALIAGCAAEQAVRTYQEAPLAEHVNRQPPKEEPHEDTTKYISVTRKIIAPFSNLPTFRFDNYKQKYPENSKKYRRTFDVEPVSAEDFSAESKEGITLNFRDFSRVNDYVIIEFTGDDCPPCKKLLAHLERFYSFNSNKIEIISVMSGGEMEWKKYTSENDVSYPLVFDSSCKILGRYGFEYIPAMVLTQKGKVISVCAGFNDYAIKWLADIEEKIK